MEENELVLFYTSWIHFTVRQINSQQLVWFIQQHKAWQSVLSDNQFLKNYLYCYFSCLEETIKPGGRYEEEANSQPNGPVWRFQTQRRLFGFAERHPCVLHGARPAAQSECRHRDLPLRSECWAGLERLLCPPAGNCTQAQDVQRSGCPRCCCPGKITNRRASEGHDRKRPPWLILTKVLWSSILQTYSVLIL